MFAHVSKFIPFSSLIFDQHIQVETKLAVTVGTHLCACIYVFVCLHPDIFNVVVQSLCPVWLYTTPWTAASPASLSFTISWIAQTHVHWVRDATQPSHPLSSPSPPAFSLSQHQGLFQWAGSSHQVAKILVLQLQHKSFQWIFKEWFRLGLTGLIYLRPNF